MTILIRNTYMMFKTPNAMTRNGQDDFRYITLKVKY